MRKFPRSGESKGRRAVPRGGSKLSERVAQRMEADLEKGAVEPGQRLPSERMMAERFQVSRAVIRESIRTLCERGLLEVRPKSGVYATVPDNRDSSLRIGRLLRRQAHAFADLGEVRFTLEVDIAGMAAARATPEDIAAMEKTVVAMEKHPHHAALFTENDLRFHTALAGATRNRLYLALMEPIQDLLMSHRLVSYRHQRDKTIKAALRHHRRILDAVKAKDAEAARDAMRDHLREAQHILAKPAR